MSHDEAFRLRQIRHVIFLYSSSASTSPITMTIDAKYLSLHDLRHALLNNMMLLWYRDFYAWCWALNIDATLNLMGRSIDFIYLIHILRPSLGWRDTVIYVISPLFPSLYRILPQPIKICQRLSKLTRTILVMNNVAAAARFHLLQSITIPKLI